METELQMLEDEHTPRWAQSNALKISNLKTLGQDGIYKFWFKNLLPYMTDLLPKWINAYRKPRHPNGWLKGRPL